MNLLLALFVACQMQNPVDSSPAPALSEADERVPPARPGHDADGDGWPSGTDCIDLDATIHPAAPEVCDGFDNNCDGRIDDADPTVSGSSAYYADVDGDGFGAGTAIMACVAPAGTVVSNTDCNDQRAAVSPAATESCDGFDNNCDGLIDDADPAVTGTTAWYADGDGDHYGAGNATSSCLAPHGTVLLNTDCDDQNAALSPSAAEVCDGIDNNCDGLADDADPTVTGQSASYADMDGDGFGAGTAALACVAPTGTVASNTDCNDQSASSSPSAAEVCDGVDNNCDGLADDADPNITGQSASYADVDGDGFGAGTAILACVAPAGTVASNTDCDDQSASSSPSAAEVCDGVDNNCDGLADDADPRVTGTTAWYADQDGDGYGAGRPTRACVAPTGSVATGADCDDQQAAVSPAATESCDGIDNNCDGLTDDADPNITGTSTWYLDLDGDGYGARIAAMACTVPTRYVSLNTDCDDHSAVISPAATESCDGIDNNCDGLTDDADPTVSGTSAWYADLDRDGYGAGTAVMACLAPRNYVSLNTDCDDQNRSTSPGGTDTCDGRDNDCSGTADDDPNQGRIWYVDDDGDNYGTSVQIRACTKPAGTTYMTGDCDDTTVWISPIMWERCDGLDQDCDGLIDEDPDVLWFPDADGDGYGLESGALRSCTAPAGYVPYVWVMHYDCDDTDAAINPLAPETCNSLDDNCDGTADEPSEYQPSTYEDLDGDGYGATWQGYTCTPNEPGFSSIAGDCDDQEASRSPDATEVCDGYDTDCDGEGDSCVAAGELSAGATLSVNLFLSHWDDLPDETGDGVGELVVESWDPAGESSLLHVVDPSSGTTLRSWTQPTEGVLSNSSSGLDYNLDGVADLTLSQWGGDSSDIYLYSANQADGASLSTWGGISDAETMDVYWSVGADFGGDGQPELMVRTPDSILLFQPVEGSILGAADAQGRVEDAAWLQVRGGWEADTDGDGRAELWLHAEDFDWGTRTWQNRLLSFADPMMQGLQEIDADQTVPLEQYQSLSVVRDMDGDGTEDFWLRQYHRWDENVSMELVDGVGNGTATSRATMEVHNSCSNAPERADDFNGDGVADLVLGCYGEAQQGSNSGKIWFFTGPFSGALTVDDAVSSYTGPGADALLGHSLYAADLDQDGRDDLLTTTVDRNTWTSSWLWLYGSQLP